jgi:hypothetical protein
LRSITILIAALALLTAAQSVPAADQGLQAAEPQRERALIDIIDAARKQYALATTQDARRAARIGLQVALHEFLGLNHDVKDWVGAFKLSKRTQEGDRTVYIEIAPGVTLRTWDSRYADEQSSTLVRSYAPMADVIDGLQLGQRVSFDAVLIGGVLSSDDDMVENPQFIAQFTRLQPKD